MRFRLNRSPCFWNSLSLFSKKCKNCRRCRKTLRLDDHSSDHARSYVPFNVTLTGPDTDLPMFPRLGAAIFLRRCIAPKKIRSSPRLVGSWTKKRSDSLLIGSVLEDRPCLFLTSRRVTALILI